MNDVRHDLGLNDLGPYCPRCRTQFPLPAVQEALKVGALEVVDVGGLNLHYMPADACDSRTLRKCNVKDEEKTQHVLAVCEPCDGFGELLSGQDCPDCNGAGMVVMSGRGGDWEITGRNLEKATVRSLVEKGDTSFSIGSMTDAEKMAHRQGWNNFLALREMSRPPEGMTKSS